MFNEFIQSLRATAETIRLHSAEYDRIFAALLEEAEAVLQDELIKRCKEAGEQTREYGSTAPGQRMLKHLLDNLEKSGHVIINKETGDLEILFNEEIAGTESDFHKADYGGSERTAAQRAVSWKYGIYKPEIEGFTPAGFDTSSLPSYSEVIDERLEAWGDKAPYWYFIEHGNFGGDRQYPTVQPTNFIGQLRLDAQAAMPDLLEAIGIVAGEVAAQDIDRSIRESRPQQPPSEMQYAEKAARKTKKSLWKHLGQIFKRRK